MNSSEYLAQMIADLQIIEQFISTGIPSGVVVYLTVPQRDVIVAALRVQPRYLSNCLRAGACHGKCESTACTNYGKDIVVRRCVEDSG